MPLTHRPRYDGDSLVNLMASLGVGLGASGNGHPPLAALDPREVAAARNVVLVLVDGLGQNLIEAHPPGFLRRHQQAVITSVFPTTTASAVTTLLTGRAPQQHGVTGWFTYLRELGAVWTVLPFKPRALPGHWDLVDLPAGEVLGLRPFADALAVETHIVTHQRIIDSSYSIATAGRARRTPYEDLAGFTDAVATLVHRDERRKFVYAYWPELDALAHRHGVASAPVTAHFQALEAALAELAERLRGTDTLFLVTADHGLIDTQEHHRLRLDDHPDLADCLALPLCGEPRAVFCYLRPGHEARFQAYVERHLAHACHCLPSRHLLEAGLFGLGAPHARLHERIGDFTLLMKDAYILKDHVFGERPFVPVGIHGGLSPAELHVPLVRLAL